MANAFNDPANGELAWATTNITFDTIYSPLKDCRFVWKISNTN